MIRSKGMAVSIFALVCAAGCADDGGPWAPAQAIRDTLADGTLVVRYDALPDSVDHVVGTDLRIGALDGAPEYVFGDVRGIEADREGTIYVLDHQASEIRTYGPGGDYRATIATEGEGPGEIGGANGMILMGDTLLWVQDHSKWRLLGLGTDGTETRRVPMHVRNYSYMWNGTVDELGRFWKPTNHSDEPRGGMPEEGLRESTSRAYLVHLDLATEEKDSVYLGERTYRSYVTRMGDRGYSMRGLPYQPSPVVIVNPDGGLWHSHGSAYRVARLDDRGDTLFVLEADVVAPPVTEEDRESVMSEVMEGGESFRRAADALVAALPETKPAISGLVVDEQGRLWVRRGGDERAGPRYDVFTEEGDFVMAVRLDFRASPYLPLKFRGGRIYALVRDELDVPYVVRATVPRLRPAQASLVAVAAGAQDVGEDGHPLLGGLGRGGRPSQGAQALGRIGDGLPRASVLDALRERTQLDEAFGAHVPCTVRGPHQPVPQEAGRPRQARHVPPVASRGRRTAHREELAQPGVVGLVAVAARPSDLRRAPGGLFDRGRVGGGACLPAHGSELEHELVGQIPGGLELGQVPGGRPEEGHVPDDGQVPGLEGQVEMGDHLAPLRAAHERLGTVRTPPENGERAGEDDGEPRFRAHGIRLPTEGASSIDFRDGAGHAPRSRRARRATTS